MSEHEGFPMKLNLGGTKEEHEEFAWYVYGVRGIPLDMYWRVKLSLARNWRLG